MERPKDMLHHSLKVLNQHPDEVTYEVDRHAAGYRLMATNDKGRLRDVSPRIRGLRAFVTWVGAYGAGFQDGREYQIEHGPKPLCALCSEPIDLNTAHRHEGKLIGDECCWDERLRATE